MLVDIEICARFWMLNLNFNKKIQQEVVTNKALCWLLTGCFVVGEVGKKGSWQLLYCEPLIVMKTCMNRTQLYFPLETSESSLYLMDIYWHKWQFDCEEAKYMKVKLVVYSYITLNRLPTLIKYLKFLKFYINLEILFCFSCELSVCCPFSSWSLFPISLTSKCILAVWSMPGPVMGRGPASKTSTLSFSTFWFYWVEFLNSFANMSIGHIYKQWRSD